MNNTDEGLLRRLAQGEDPEAYGVLLNRYADMVYSTCFRILRDSAEAADVTQETFFQLFKAAERITGSAGGWLHQVATRRCVDVVRQNASRRERENVYAQDIQPLNAQGSSWAEVAPFVDQAIERLPEQERDLVIQHFLERKSMTELAAETGLSQPTISRRIAQGLELMRTHLRAQGVSLGVVPLQTLLLNSALEAPEIVLQGLGKMGLLGAATTSGASAAATTAAATTAATAVIGKSTLAFAGFGAVAALVIAVAQPSTDFAPTAPLPPRAARPAVAAAVPPQTEESAAPAVPIITAEAAPAPALPAPAPEVAASVPKRPPYLLVYRTNAPAVSNALARAAALQSRAPASAAQPVYLPPAAPAVPPVGSGINDPELVNEYMQLYRPMLMQAQMLATSSPPTSLADPAKQRLPNAALPNAGYTPQSPNRPLNRSFTLGPGTQQRPPAQTAPGRRPAR